VKSSMLSNNTSNHTWTVLNFYAHTYMVDMG
jgi:hypothetical protein